MSIIACLGGFRTLPARLGPTTHPPRNRSTAVARPAAAATSSARTRLRSARSSRRDFIPCRRATPLNVMIALPSVPETPMRVTVTCVFMHRSWRLGRRPRIPTRREYRARADDVNPQGDHQAVKPRPPDEDRPVRQPCLTTSMRTTRRPSLSASLPMSDVFQGKQLVVSVRWRCCTSLLYSGRPSPAAVTFVNYGSRPVGLAAADGVVMTTCRLPRPHADSR